MTEIATRKRNPVRPNTLHVYRSLLNARILPVIGGKDLSDVGNGTAKLLVSRLTEASLSPATVNLAVVLVKQIVASAVDGEGNQLYPRTWNMDFIQAPEVDPTSQKAPIMVEKGLSQSISATFGATKALIGLLAGSALRIGEALALGVPGGNVWDPVAGTVSVRATMVHGTLQTDPKTKAGNRVVDLSPELNALLNSQFANHEGPLFPACEMTYRRQIAALGIPGFHSLRRFRITHLQSKNVPGPLIKFWAGHAAGDVTERYTKMGAQIEERKTWSEKAGLGFELHA